MKWILAVILVVAVCRVVRAADDGEPFGHIGETEIDRLAVVSKTAGFDFNPEMERVYKKDEAALGRLFKLSLSFDTLDGNARAYGHVLYCSLLNLGEATGVDAYVKVLDRQPPKVQQRVRDYFYYATILSVAKELQAQAIAETRKEYPTLFPKGFQFAHDDPVFAKAAEP